jgi:hypothetical protein
MGRQGFSRHNFLRNHTDTSALTSPSIEEEFSKERARISFQNAYMSEMSDVDGIFWGNQFTYPIEIKEKTIASDSKVGDYFGLMTWRSMHRGIRSPVGQTCSGSAGGSSRG